MSKTTKTPVKAPAAPAVPPAPAVTASTLPTLAAATPAEKAAEDAANAKLQQHFPGFKIEFKSHKRGVEVTVTKAADDVAGQGAKEYLVDAVDRNRTNALRTVSSAIEAFAAYEVSTAATRGTNYDFTFCRKIVRNLTNYTGKGDNKAGPVAKWIKSKNGTEDSIYVGYYETDKAKKTAWVNIEHAAAEDRDRASLAVLNSLEDRQLLPAAVPQ